MPSGPSKRNQSSPSQQDGGNWFDLPDLQQRNARRRGRRPLLICLASVAALLLFALFQGGQ